MEGIHLVFGKDCFPGSSVLGATPSISIFNSVDRSSFGISNYLEDEDSISGGYQCGWGGIVDPVILVAEPVGSCCQVLHVKPER